VTNNTCEIQISNHYRDETLEQKQYFFMTARRHHRIGYINLPHFMVSYTAEFQNKHNLPTQESSYIGMILPIHVCLMDHEVDCDTTQFTPFKYIYTLVSYLIQFRINILLSAVAHKT